VINVAAGRRTSLNELWGVIRDITGAPVPPRYAPTRIGDVRDSLADLSRARDLLGFEPHVDLREGLRRTIQSFAEPARSGESSR
jgi:nucleoside-diphosphate-sugar epimerase